MYEKQTGGADMQIEISRDIERYQETVAMGLTAKQLFFSLASITAGGGLILLLYPFIGLTISAYVAIPVVAPIALGGFYSYNGMSFYEVMRRKFEMIFANRPLIYSSTEREDVIRQLHMEEALLTGIGKKAGKGMNKQLNKPA